jgi:hypothetical protein
MRKSILISSLFAAFLLGCSGGGSAENDSGTDAVADVVTEKVPEASPPVILDAGFVDGQFDLNPSENDPMIYHNGPVMVSPVNVYFIWYGNWTDPKTAPILEDLIKGMGNSAWYQINTGYWQQATPLTWQSDGGADAGYSKKIHFPQHRNGPSSDGGTIVTVVDAGPPTPSKYVTNSVNFLKSVYVGYTHGVSLQDSDITKIVSETIQGGKLPPDPDAVYFVLTSSDVTESDGFSGFCSDYCGWHGNHRILGLDIKLAFIGDTGACSTCSLQDTYVEAGITNSPNGDWSADSMASVIAHELSESVTDPDPNTVGAWQDDYGEENADKCAWTFGQAYPTDNNSAANVPIGNRNFMLQQNWVLDSNGGHCGLNP